MRVGGSDRGFSLGAVVATEAMSRAGAFWTGPGGVASESVALGTACFIMLGKLFLLL
jgi:hypothetical protein